jgi:hypothetical protein
MLVVWRHTSCTFHTPGGGKGYPLHVHTARRCGRGKEYTLHAHTTSVKKFKKMRTEQFRAPRLFSYQSPIN